jgi:hypothetical protein
MNNAINKESSPEEKETKSGKIFFIIFGLLIFGSVFATFYRTVIKKNYTVEAQTDCDPYTQKCFVWQCDPASDVEGEKCTGDAEKDIWYYKLSRRNASKIPLCDPNKDENCTPMICDTSEKDCEEIFCDDETKVAQEVECRDPVEYTRDNPLEEETATDETTCAEGDTECEANSATDSSAEEAECAPDDAQCQNPVNQADTAPADASPAE